MFLPLSLVIGKFFLLLGEGYYTKLELLNTNLVCYMFVKWRPHVHTPWCGVLYKAIKLSNTPATKFFTIPIINSYFLSTSFHFQNNSTLFSKNLDHPNQLIYNFSVIILLFTTIVDYNKMIVTALNS